MHECKLRGDDRLRILACKPRPPLPTVRMERLVCSEPLELEYLYTVLQGTDEVHLLDGMADRRDPVRLAKRIRAQVVLFTSYITDINTVLDAAGGLKRLPEPPLVFVGGPHAEVVPEHFCTDNVDGVLFANQLQGLVTVVNRIRANEDYSDTPGGLFPVNGTFRRNAPAPLDVENLPHPSRILLDRTPNKYRYLYYHPCASIKTAFGCAHRCTFCFCREMNNGVYSARPISCVADEIEGIPVKNIIILDDDFLTGRRRLAEFCDEIQKRGIEKEFVAYGRARFVAQNPDVMRELRRAGLTGLMVGFEFVTDRELKTFDKDATVLDNDRTIEICRELDIELFALFMVNPDWRHEDFRRLAHYLREKELALAVFATITVFPGTELAREQERVFDVNTRWWRYDLLRLHANPRHMSSWSYYLWLFYLYMLPVSRLSGLRRLWSRCGVWGTVKLFFSSWLIGLEYAAKLLIWR